MTTKIAEKHTLSDRYMRLVAYSPSPEHADKVFVAVPCAEASQGEHVFGFDRAEFYAALRGEFGLVDPLEELFAAASVDGHR